MHINDRMPGAGPGATEPDRLRRLHAGHFGKTRAGIRGAPQPVEPRHPQVPFVAINRSHAVAPRADRDREIETRAAVRADEHRPRVPVVEVKLVRVHAVRKQKRFDPR